MSRSAQTKYGHQQICIFYVAHVFTIFHYNMVQRCTNILVVYQVYTIFGIGMHDNNDWVKAGLMVVVVMPLKMI